LSGSPKFNSTYNEIPVFAIPHMRMQKRPEPGDEASGTQPTTLLPMYFSLQNLVGTWQQFMASAPPEAKSVEPAINLLPLHEIIAMLQKESEIDWRNVVLIPSSSAAGGPAEASAGSNAAAAIGASAGLGSSGDPEEAMASMGGATLGDI